MKKQLLGSVTNVKISAREVEDFKAQWPCSGLPSRAITFQFDNRNGDLIDMWPNNLDGAACLALSQDAQKFAGLGSI